MLSRVGFEPSQDLKLAMLSSVESKICAGQKNSCLYKRYLKYNYRDALHSKIFRNQVEYYAKEELPTYGQLKKRMNKDLKPQLARRLVVERTSPIMEKKSNG